MLFARAYATFRRCCLNFPFLSWVNMLSAVNWYRYSSTRPGTHFMVVAEASTLQTAVSFFAGDTHFSFCRVHSSSIRMCVCHVLRTWYILPVVCKTPRHMNNFQLCPAGCWSRGRCCAAVCLCVVCCCCTCGAVRISYLFLAPYFCILHLLSFRIQR